jgi:hypothetical protein
MYRSPGPFVYGALIVGAVLDAESQKQETFPETVAGIVITIVLLWLAHTYAQVIGQRVQKGEQLSFGLIGDKMAHEFSILTGAALPLVVVLIWWVGGGTLAGALSAGVWTAAITIVAANLLAGFRANLSGADLVFQTAVGAFLGLGILVLKLIYH